MPTDTTNTTDTTTGAATDADDREDSDDSDASAGADRRQRKRSFMNDDRGIKGVLVLGTAMFLLVVWYLVGAFAIEPFIKLGRGVNLTPFGGQSRLSELRDIYFLYAPMAWLFAWFIWAVRYYLSPNKVVARRGGP